MNDDANLRKKRGMSDNGTALKKNRLVYFLIIPAILFFAALIGRSGQDQDMLALIQQAIPDAEQIENAGEDVFTVTIENRKSYIGIAESQGYGGPLLAASMITADGRIQNVFILEHTETPAFYARVIKSGFLDVFRGRDCGDDFILDVDLDSVSGATITSQAAAAAVRLAARKAAAFSLSQRFDAETSDPFRPGREVYLISVLFIFTILSSLKKIKYARILRRITQVYAIVVMGFILNSFISLVSVNRLLSGYPPAFFSEFIFYLLLIFVLIFLLFMRRNIYCDRLCPFGAFQECMGIIGGRGIRIPAKVVVFLRWMQRIIALVLIVSALLYANPSLLNYEISIVLFSLFGPVWQFALLGLFLVLSIFIRRPWCLSLCPVRPVFDYFLEAGRWFKEVYYQVKPHQKSGDGVKD